MGEIRQFTRDEELQSRMKDWEFFEYTYCGGEEYIENSLIQHERESDEAFKRRRAEACVVNLCAPVVDIYNFYMFRTDPVRDAGSIESHPLYEAFLDDADFYGNRYEDVIKAIAERGSVYGVFGVVVDKPNIQANSLAEEIAQNVRPYIATYEPENIWNIEYERTSGGKPQLVRVVLEEDDDVLREWTLYEVTLWQKRKDTKNDYEVMDGYPVPNTLGTIPFVLHTNRMALEPLEAASDIADLAYIQRAILNNDSKMLEAMGKAAFPMMEIPDASLPAPSGNSVFDGGQQDSELVVGSGNALIRNGNDSIGHRYVEPQMYGTQRYLEIRKALIDDFMQIARTSHANAQSRQQQSGVALEIEFQQLNALLAMKASCMERTEERILALVAKWLGQEFDGSVKYSDSFGIRDVAHDIDAAIKSLTVITSQTYKATIAKQLASQMLDDDTERDVIDKISAELDSPSTPMNTLAMLNQNGVVAQQQQAQPAQ